MMLIVVYGELVRLTLGNSKDWYTWVGEPIWV